MRHFLFTLFFIFNCCMISTAQIRFSKQFELYQEQNDARELARLGNGNLVFGGQHIGNTIYTNDNGFYIPEAFHLSMMHSNGYYSYSNLIYNNTYYQVKLNSLETVGENDNELVAAVYIDAIQGLVKRGGLAKFDEYLGLQWYKSPSFKAGFNTKAQNYFTNRINFASAGYGEHIVYTGEDAYLDNNGDESYYVPIVELDKNGNATSNKKEIAFDGGNEWVGGAQLEKIGNNNYALLTKHNIQEEGELDIESFSVTTLNQNFNPGWSKKIGMEGKGLRNSQMLIDAENGVIAVSYHTQYGNYSDVVHLIELNMSNGSVQFNGAFPVGSNNSVIEGMSQDEDYYYMAGNVGLYSLFYGSKDGPIVMKIAKSNKQGHAKIYGKEYLSEGFWDIERFNDQWVSVGMVGSNTMSGFPGEESIVAMADANGYINCDFFEKALSPSTVEVNVSNPSLNLYNAELIYGEEEELSESPFLLSENTCFSGFEPIDPFGWKNSSDIDLSQLSPNPSKGAFTVKLGATFNKQEKVDAQIFNVNGQLVHQSAFYGPSKNWESLNLEPGLYVIQLKQAGKSEQLKLIIH